MSEQRWWQTSSVYEIYPRSFADSNGDGVGDLEGIRHRLEYLSWLGVDAVWIAPFYRSPMADFGYDVADHTDVDPLFGSLADFDRLLTDAHARGLRVIVGYVPNHTSDRHPWFVASRSSRTDPHRDWYTWRDPRPGGRPPNNWISMFGGPAWEWDGPTGQYYLHSFLREQPDVDWRHPAARAAMLDVARVWLDRGVDGFRIDTAPFVAKDPELRDNPPNPHPETLARLGDWSQQLHLYDHGHPDLHGIYREFRRLCDSYPGDRVSIGELHHPDYGVWAGYYGEQLDEIHVPFNFYLMHAPWDATEVRCVVDAIEAALPSGAWPNWVLGNHDQLRLASRIGAAQARVAMLLLLTLRGTPALYYGEELGMTNAVITPPQVRDPWGLTEPGQGRDPERSPMQWDASPTAGFCPPGVEPWLPLAPEHETVNVGSQRDDPGSMLCLTRSLLRLRREHPALATGSYRALGDTPDGTICYLRQTDAGAPSVLVALNFTDAPQTVDLPGPPGAILAATHPDRHAAALADSALALRPNEGLVLELS